MPPLPDRVDFWFNTAAVLWLLAIFVLLCAAVMAGIEEDREKEKNKVTEVKCNESVSSVR